MEIMNMVMSMPPIYDMIFGSLFMVSIFFFGYYVLADWFFEYLGRNLA